MQHPGFQSVQRTIAAKQGIPMKNAGAILASAGRKASPSAKRKNPRLAKIKGRVMPKKVYSRMQSL